MNKRDLIIYRVVTSLFSALILMGVGMYIFQHDMVKDMYTALGFPTFLIYPVGIAKFLAIVTIWSNKSKFLKEWAYAGLFFNLLFANMAHLNAGDGEYAGPAMVFIGIIVSYIYDRKLYPRN
ncbi:MAG: DoxX family protein [Bacteroidia bacterium]|nr:DoxX family protein [Bacteroidia bacterium]